MPRRQDLKSILLIGSGPIVIGQACEFDYSGAQACKALREEGFRVSLVNSNPATIMTDPEFADATYIEPLTVESVTKIIEKERPDALLPTLGGQTGLNLSLELFAEGVLGHVWRMVAHVFGTCSNHFSPDFCICLEGFGEWGVCRTKLGDVLGTCLRCFLVGF